MMEQKEEDEDPGMAACHGLVLLTALRTATDAPYMDWRLRPGARSPGRWDHVVLQARDDRHWGKAPFLEPCEQLAPTLQCRHPHEGTLGVPEVGS